MTTMCCDKSRPLAKLGSIGPKQLEDLMKRFRKYRHRNRWRYKKAMRRVVSWIEERL